MSVRTRLPKDHHKPTGLACRTPTAHTKPLKVPVRGRLLKQPAGTRVCRRPDNSFSLVSLVTSAQSAKPAAVVPIELPDSVRSRKTVVFDLDETLVHCVKNNEKLVPDTVLSLTKPSGNTTAVKLKMRPFAIECLREASKVFEVVVFTAAQQFYADPVIDWLDPSGELIHHRLYREHCTLVNGVCVKDLRVIANRALKDIVIVDNAIRSFACNLDNGIPIRPWLGDKHDRELLKLLDYFQVLKLAKDVRDANRCKFHLALYYEEYKKYAQMPLNAYT